MQPNQNIEINYEFEQAFNIIENSNRNLLLLGKAGTGKSTFLQYLRSHTKKNIALLAPTGVASINIQGMTIHSFFGFSIDITLDKVKRYAKTHRVRKLLQKLDTIIIDEISMVRADLLDCVNKFLMLNSRHFGQLFGGIQMVFIGDLYQIPPVVKSDLAHFFKTQYASPYFFSSKVFQENKDSFELIEFEKIYRQRDQRFIEILNAIRNNSVTTQHFAILNQRLQPNFEPSKEDFWLYITGTNAAVKKINDIELAKISRPAKTYFAIVEGKINQESFPTDAELKLKVGAQVMMVNNDSAKRWVNGTIGQIVAINQDKEKQVDAIAVKLADSEVVNVFPEEWDVFKYDFNEEKNTLTTIKTGSFVQYPLRLAWAITVHKSQGKTFDNIIVNLGMTFTPGQMYVALSRCTSLEGLVLKSKVAPHNVFIDHRIVDFVTNFQYQKAEIALPLNVKIELIKDAITKKQRLKIIYLKAKDEKSHRIIEPTFVGEIEYQNKKFIGVGGLCVLRNESRAFRLDRILDIKVIEKVC